jgi:hypothetical protein
LSFQNPDQVRMVAETEDDRAILGGLADDKVRQFFKVVSWSPDAKRTGPRFVDKQPDASDPTRPNEVVPIPSDVNRVWLFLVKAEK